MLLAGLPPLGEGAVVGREREARPVLVVLPCRVYLRK